MTVDEHYINRLLLRLEQREAKPTPPPNVIYVTDLASICARKVWYSRRYPPEPTEHEAIKHIGRALHELLEEALMSDGWIIEIPVAINDNGITIRGRVDAALEEAVVKDDGSVEARTTDVLEIKTVDGLPDHPRPEHVHQAVIYAAVLRARRYHIVYVSRRDGRVRVFSNEAPDHENTIIAAKEAARELAKIIQSETPPPPNRGPWCSYCPYRWRCWGGRA